MIDFKLDPKEVAEVALEIDKMRKNPFTPRCRCRLLPIDTGKLIDTGVLMSSIYPEPIEPVVKGK